ncbi:hypothetical protein SDC9_207523 [bioreactor metagenome]|uniref:Uncharacterized protein n=1 Tax=bioreactor metagenome TaxID=1076179 RepID=A0A645J853_9ZZZZ
MPNLAGAVFGNMVSAFLKLLSPLLGLAGGRFAVLASKHRAAAV